ncbi:hypothetical protein [Nostoc sp.]
MENTLVQSWKGLSLKLRQRPDSAGQFYTETSLKSWRGRWGG